MQRISSQNMIEWFTVAMVVLLIFDDLNMYELDELKNYYEYDGIIIQILNELERYWAIRYDK